MKNKEITSIYECETINDWKELQARRYKKWYEKNREQRLKYHREYYLRKKIEQAKQA